MPAWKVSFSWHAEEIYPYCYGIPESVMQMGVWKSGWEKDFDVNYSDLLTSKWVHWNVKNFFHFLTLWTTIISRPHPIAGFHLAVPLRSAQKWDDQEVSVYVTMLIDTLVKFLKIKLFYGPVKISSKHLHQNIMYLNSMYPYDSLKIYQIYGFCKSTPITTCYFPGVQNHVYQQHIYSVIQVVTKTLLNCHPVRVYPYCP